MTNSTTHDTAASSPHALAADFLGFESELPPEQLERLASLRARLVDAVEPRMSDLWEAAAFPKDVPGILAQEGLLTPVPSTGSPAPGDALFHGFVTMELARVDASLSTFYGVHRGLAMSSISLLGSPEQRDTYLPGMEDGSIVGAFGLTEPFSGSDAARGLNTTARREGDTWVLNGAKRWIGNGTWADIVIIWAKDVEDGAVKGFIVPTDTPGFEATAIAGKMSHRPVQNADIVLDDARVPETLRLPEATSFAATNRILKLTRVDVAWAAVGNAIGAYEKALKYTGEREQFGAPIARRQLVQRHLVEALSDLTSALAVTVQATRMLEAGTQKDEHSALAKLIATTNGRSAVAHCREVLGGNGITLEQGVIRHFLDAEALYSFEGTAEMNTLIVGRSITGLSAFL